MTIIDSGAEAIIKLEDNKILKERVSKSYRLEEIDYSLRKSRTRKEARILKKLEELNFPSPKINHVDEKNMIIDMEYIEGDKLKNILEKDSLKLCHEIGKKVGILHSNDVVHGDLTTSNMIFRNEVHFIDFGLSFNSNKIEDKAVDLHLFRQALESKHHTIWEESYEEFLKGYEEVVENSKEILKRLEEVELRGRNKH